MGVLGLTILGPVPDMVTVWRQAAGISLTFLLLLVSYSSAQYVPGQPGGTWTEEEVLVVKSKLIQIISNPHTPYAQLYPGHSWTWTRMPTAAKFLRLGFHDCLKYMDGSGGCDGCQDAGMLRIDELNDLGCCCFCSVQYVANGNYFEKNPEKIQGFMKAMRRATDFTIEHPDA